MRPPSNSRVTVVARRQRRLAPILLTATLICLALSRPSASPAIALQQSAKSPELAQADKLLDDASKIAAADRDRAISLAQQALAIREKQLGPDDAAVGDALYSLGTLLRGAGDNSGAAARVTRASDILAKTNPNSPELATVLGAGYWNR